jgi:hypothetical protein
VRASPFRGSLRIAGIALCFIASYAAPGLSVDQKAAFEPGYVHQFLLALGSYFTSAGRGLKGKDASPEIAAATGLDRSTRRQRCPVELHRVEEITVDTRHSGGW